MERLGYLIGGLLLTAVGTYLAWAPTRNARVIESYYKNRAESETASGIWGRRLFVPGPKASLVMAWLITLIAFAVGIAAMVYALVEA